MPTIYVEDREALRRWLVQRYRQQGFNVPKLAADLQLTKQAIHRWIQDGTPVPPKYWTGIARFFGFADAQALMGAVRHNHARARR